VEVRGQHMPEPDRKPEADHRLEVVHTLPAEDSNPVNYTPEVERYNPGAVQNIPEVARCSPEADRHNSLERMPVGSRTRPSPILL
jgi:hypothetical protein